MMINEKDQSILNDGPVPRPPPISELPPYDENAYPVSVAPHPLPSRGLEVDTVNQLHIRRRRGDVTGTYAVDPLLYVPGKQNRKGGCCSSKQAADASFRSKHGAVSLNLATKGNPNEPSKAFVEVITRRGSINVDLFSLQPGKNIHLDAYSRRGHILVLIPRNFRGAIHIRGRKNGHQILPALSMASRVLKSTHQENLILVGEPSPSTSGDGTDFLELRSRHGKITVGYTGDDAYQPDDTSFWQKFFGGGKA
ncbi:hypothetical protein FIBSPDRAFT_783140 [Athelia psychrophila]|uniref:DUF7330 domain-containing protein n=1 Tax=Athelia psychrophila TaxID=1759441 RepID=A0A166P0M0_9AGAM|nr:hypothetical protein FIBSPDRAFT_783140 [Fibularhizoctonia sp. CBS 109695]